MSNLMTSTRTMRARITARLAAFGIGSIVLVVVGLAIDVAPIPLIAMRHSWAAGAVLLASIFCGVLGRTNADGRWRDLSNTFDLIVLAGMPFAFALADPSRAIAACFLLFAIVTTVAASLFAQHLPRLETTDRLVGVAALVVACVMPQWFSLIAYAVGLAAFIAAGMRVSLALSRSDG
jgi:hypothetical protein